MQPLTEKEFRQLVDYIKTNYGINLTHKKTFLVGRLQNYIIQNNFQSFSAYLAAVMADRTGTAVADLVNKITTNHTFFMRETEHFDYFRTQVLPWLALTEKNRKDLRIWSAGCSSGEEPYTLAMLMTDYFGREKFRWDTKVLATDISTKALTRAVRGIYDNEQLSALPQNWRLNYFNKCDQESSEITDKLKNEVIFRRFNLMETVFPFKRRFHAIFCRNVMIYFDAQTRKELVARFYEYTEPGGYLFIGHSESLHRDETQFKYIRPAVYRRE